MKAALIYEYGSPDVFKVEDIPKPSVGAKDVLIEVHASSVNPIDWKIRKGAQRGAIRYRLPHVLGMDVSGVVVEVGAKVSRFKVGDEVYSSPSHKRSGTYAEFVAIEERGVALKPKNMTHQEAASIPLVGLTAWEGLVRLARLKAGQRVLIQAGSGGVGTFAIQLAKHLGAEVYTTCSTRNVELCTELGADRVIDYTKEEFDQVLNDVDVVLDSLGGEHKKRSAGIIKPGGALPSIVAGLPGYTEKYGPNLGVLFTIWDMLTFNLSMRLFRGIRASNVLRPLNGEMLGQITKLIEEGKIRAVVDRVFPLDEIADAHRYSQTGRARGKIVIAVK